MARAMASCYVFVKIAGPDVYVLRSYVAVAIYWPCFYTNYIARDIIYVKLCDRICENIPSVCSQETEQETHKIMIVPNIAVRHYVIHIASLNYKFG